MRARYDGAMSRPRSAPSYLPIIGAAALGVALACSSKDDAPALSLNKDTIRDPESCKTCHQGHYTEWSGSMHALAADDPVFVAMNKRGQRETNGALGDFCVKCHAPMAVRDGLTKDGLNLATLPKSSKGVTCYFCHSVDRIDGAHDNPLHLADDLVIRGEYADPVKNTAHAATYSLMHDRDKAESASLCGPCHDITTSHGANIERTFAEWQASVFSQPGGATCSQCHMEQSSVLRQIANFPGALSRRTHAHTFAGVDTALFDGAPQVEAQQKAVKAILDTALQSALCVRQAGPAFALRVLLDNVGGGHGLPSGSTQDRRLWVEVIAYKGPDVIYKSGVVPPGADATASVTTDPDLWLIRDCMFDETGKPVHDFWNAASYEANQLPAQLTFVPTDPRFYQTHVVQAFPRSGDVPGTPDRVTMRVLLEPLGRDVLNDLVATGDLSAADAARVQPLIVGADPVLEWTAATATDTYLEDRLPVACITKTNFNVAADKVPAPKRTRCAP